MAATQKLGEMDDSAFFVPAPELEDGAYSVLITAHRGSVGYLGEAQLQFTAQVLAEPGDGDSAIPGNYTVWVSLPALVDEDKRTENAQKILGDDYSPGAEKKLWKDRLKQFQKSMVHAHQSLYGWDKLGGVGTFEGDEYFDTDGNSITRAEFFKRSEARKKAAYADFQKVYNGDADLVGYTADLQVFTTQNGKRIHTFRLKRQDDEYGTVEG